MHRSPFAPVLWLVPVVSILGGCAPRTAPPPNEPNVARASDPSMTRPIADPLTADAVARPGLVYPYNLPRYDDTLARELAGVERASPSPAQNDATVRAQSQP